MRWSDPFTGWFDGGIGRWAYVGWVLVFITLNLATVFVAALVQRQTGSSMRSDVVIVALLLVPFWLNLDAKRWRDAGLNGWGMAILFMIVQKGVSYLSDSFYAGVFMYVAAACFRPDQFGHRVEREPVADPEVFD